MARKSKTALDGGIGVILCCGESLEEREAGTTEEVVKSQLSKVNDVIGKQGWEKIVVAYEPIWAIGTGKVASTGKICLCMLPKAVSHKVKEQQLICVWQNRTSTRGSRRDPLVAGEGSIFRSGREHENHLRRQREREELS